MAGTTRYQRDILPCQPTVALVHGCLRHDRRIHFGHHLRLSARHGAADADDLSADVHGLYYRLCRGGLRVAAAILQAQPDIHLCLSGTTTGATFPQDGFVALPAVKDDGCRRALLRGVHHPPAFRVRTAGRAFRRDHSHTGAADMALHPHGRHQDAGMDGLLADALPLYGPTPYYI